MALQTDYPQMHVLEGRVCFDRQRRHLHTHDAQVELKENEAKLLSALLSGVQDKREIIELLWESRGVIVTENNYYKVVKGLRNAFEAIGLPAELLKTLPRVGLAYVGTAEVCRPQVAADDAVAPVFVEAPTLVSPPATPVSRLSAVRARWARLRPHLVSLQGYLFGAAIVVMAALCGSLLLKTDNGFRLLGRQDGIRIYVYRDPGIPAREILSRYRRFTVEGPNARFLYYRAVGQNYIILACPTALPDGAESCVSLMQKNI